MYRDDESARGARADALITEIAELERQRVTRAEQDQRLETAELKRIRRLRHFPDRCVFRHLCKGTDMIRRSAATSPDNIDKAVL